jgi:hypothetical protein
MSTRLHTPTQTTVAARNADTSVDRFSVGIVHAVNGKGSFLAARRLH